MRTLYLISDRKPWVSLTAHWDVKGSSAVYFSISNLEIKMYGNNIHKKTKRKMVLFPMNMLLIDSCKNLLQSTLCTDKDDLNTSDFSGNVIKKS